MKPTPLHPPLHPASHGSLGGYVVGLLLSVMLTFASFGAVMSGMVPPVLALTAIVALCVFQLTVQLVFFLHLGFSRHQRSHSGIMVCTVFLIAIVVAGSLWVAHNANTNMMPTQMSVDGAISKD
jgi:cytochrome o ubiquinol oxidase operon protein cyoD